MIHLDGQQARRIEKRGAVNLLIGNYIVLPVWTIKIVIGSDPFCIVILF